MPHLLDLGKKMYRFFFNITTFLYFFSLWNKNTVKNCEVSSSEVKEKKYDKVSE